MSTLTIKRDDLIKHLEQQKKLAREVDKKNAREHRQRERQALAEFRDACRAALKWDYETLKKNRFKVTDRYWDGPSCPTLLEPKFDGAIRRLKLDQRVQLKLSDSGQDAGLYSLATWVPDPGPQTVCD